MTFKSDVQEYNAFKFGNLKPVPTRGVIVDTTDPLFAGRVKVWIPAIHGPSVYRENGIEDPDSASSSASSSVPGVVSPGSFKSPDVIASLPWAKVMSHGLGPTLDLETGVTGSSGVFSTPEIGTEVFLIFENNDPNLPIVIGSIIHASEFRYSLARPLEYLPGILLSDITQVESKDDPSTATPVEVADYPFLVSSVYNIRTSSGSTLFISDDPSNRTIVLEGAIDYKDESTLTSIEEAQLSRIYPAFPTTASAAFSKRQLLSTDATSPLVTPATGPASTVNSNNQVTVDTVNAQSPNSVPIEQSKAAQAASATVMKSYPVSGNPRWSSGLGLFGAGPDGKLRKSPHVGVDIGANADGSTILLAPIDCYPLYFTTINQAGLMLLVLGVDGFAHSLLHMRAVYPEIVNLCYPNQSKLIKRGTPMGICGFTEKTAHNTGPHLHWEVFPAGNAHTGVALAQQRMTLAHQNPIPSGMVNPHDWIKSSSGNNKASVITATPEQVQRIMEYSALDLSTAQAQYAKPAGLEMSLTPGKETINLRHPSGSFIGFDPDGNILIYSCGDINFRVNRSITYDVFGVIMENCFAKFSRVKTIIKSWSAMFTNLKNKATADTTMPEFFTRVEKTRAIDMANALASNLGNSLDRKSVV